MASVENKEVAAIQAAEERSGVVDGAFDDFGGPEDQGGGVSPDCLIGLCGLDDQGSPGGHSNQCAPGSLNGQGHAEAHDDQGGLDAPGDQGDADAHEHQRGPGANDIQGRASAHDHHGGPGAPNDQGGPDPQENQGGAGVLDHQEGHHGALYDHGGNRGILRPEVLERVEFAVVGAPNVARAERVSGPGGDAASEAEGRGDRPIILYPFQHVPEAWYPMDGSRTFQNAI